MFGFFMFLLFFLCVVVSAIGTIWVTEKTDNSLEVEWENPATDVDYYKLRYSSLAGQASEKEVVIPRSSDPKSRYLITGKC